MEDLIAQQNADGATIQQFISNIKKAPIDRRTLDFFQTKSSELEALWGKFNERDNIIRRSYGNETTHPYFVNDFFSLMGTKVDPIREELSKNIAQLQSAIVDVNKKPPIVHQEQPSGSGAQRTKANDMGESLLKAQIKKQKAIISTVSKLLKQVLDDDSAHTPRYFAMQVTTIKRHWKTAQDLHEIIWGAIEVLDPAVYDYEKYTQQEAEIINQLATLEDMAQKAVPNEGTINVQSNKPSVKLPRIELPTFDGDYLKWRQFRDLFIELVDKQWIPLCQKMWYLKSSLTGEASKLIQHFPAIASYYSSAWQVINDRFENTRLLVNAILKRLLSQPQATTEGAGAIKMLHDTTQECLLSLQNVGIDVQSWDPILLHILIQRLNKTTHALWEQSLQEPKELPSLKNFRHFLRSRFQSL